MLGASTVGLGLRMLPNHVYRSKVTLPLKLVLISCVSYGFIYSITPLYNNTLLLQQTSIDYTCTPTILNLKSYSSFKSFFKMT